MTPIRINTVKRIGFLLTAGGALFWAYWVYTSGLGSYRTVTPYVVIIALMGGSLALKVVANLAGKSPWWLGITPGWVPFLVLLSTLYNFLVAIAGFPVVGAYAVLVIGFGALLLASVTTALLAESEPLTNDDPTPTIPATEDLED